MLDSFQIFTKGGLILFQWSLMDVPKGSPVDELVKQCLLEERAGETEFTHVAGSSAYTLRWRTHNALGLVFVAVYQKILRLDYVDDLLDRCRDAFAEAYDPSSAKLAYPEFTETFTATLRAEEARANARRAPKERAPRAFDAAKRAAKRNDASGAARGVDDGAVDDANDAGAIDAAQKDVSGVAQKDTGAFDMSKIRASLKSKGGGSKGGGGSGSNLAARAGADREDEKKEKKKKEKEKRVWAGENAKGKTDGLDFSEGKPSDKEGNAEVERVDISAPSRVDAEEDEEYSSEEEEEEEEVGGGRSEALGGPSSCAAGRGRRGSARRAGAAFADAGSGGDAGRGRIAREDGAGSVADDVSTARGGETWGDAGGASSAAPRAPTTAATRGRGRRQRTAAVAAARRRGRGIAARARERGRARRALLEPTTPGAAGRFL